jgi:hypothetical protein
MRPYMARAQGKTIYACKGYYPGSERPAALGSSPTPTGQCTWMSPMTSEPEAWLAVRRDHDGNLDMLRMPDGRLA